jgi:predicted protein tyrosine phosphatase
MRLVGCALADLDREVVRHRPAGVVTLLSPSQAAPPLPSDTARLVLSFHDIAEPAAGLTAPTSAMVADLLSFAASFPAGATLLLHCWMGISRSPAAAFILACASAPAGAEAEIAAALRHAAPSATPNALLVSLADDRLARGGAMRAAIAAIGRGAEAASGDPFKLDARAWEAGS